MILFSLAFSFVVNAQSPKGCEEGQTFIKDSVEAGKKKFELFVCDAGGKNPRNISRGEYFKMYNATKTDAANMATWGKIAETTPESDKILAKLKEIPEQDLVGMEETDRKVLEKMSSWYQIHVARKAESVPKILTKADEEALQKSAASIEIANCLKSGGTLVMSESKNASANGCMCGKSKFGNFVDYTCTKGKLAPSALAATESTAGAVK